MNKGKKRFGGEKLSGLLELPGGLLGGGAHIELCANRQAIIDGKCTVLEYSDQIVRLNTGSGIIACTGTGLQICNLKNDGVTVTGRIRALTFDQ